MDDLQTVKGLSRQSYGAAVHHLRYIRLPWHARLAERVARWLAGWARRRARYYHPGSGQRVYPEWGR